MDSEFTMFMDGVVGDVMQCMTFLIFLPQNVLMFAQIFKGPELGLISAVNFCSELRFACFSSLLNKALFFLNCMMFSRDIFLLFLVLSSSRDVFHQGTVFFLLKLGLDCGIEIIIILIIFAAS